MVLMERMNLSRDLAEVVALLACSRWMTLIPNAGEVDRRHQRIPPTSILGLGGKA